MRPSTPLRTTIGRVSAVAVAVAAVVTSQLPSFAVVPEPRRITDFACPAGEVPDPRLRRRGLH